MLGTFVQSNTGGEGLILGPASATWATTRDSVNGPTIYTAQPEVNPRANIATGVYDINRYFMAIDTRNLPPSIINSGTLTLMASTPAVFSNSDTTFHVAVKATQADPPTATGTTDYAKITFTSVGSVALASLSDNTPFNIPITDASAIRPGQYTKIAIINSRDLNNAAPTGLNQSNFFTVFNGTVANQPILVVNFTPYSYMNLTSKMW